MGNFNITILGCGSATPTVRHMPSAQAVAYGGRLMLIDCGEGTQLQLRRFGPGCCPPWRSTRTEAP